MVNPAQKTSFMIIEPSPKLSTRVPKPDEEIFRHNDCAHIENCRTIAAVDKKAKSFSCDGCNAYVNPMEQRLQLVKKDNKETVETKADAEWSSDELFETPQPYVLKQVLIEDILVDYTIDQKTFKNLSISVNNIGVLQTVILREAPGGLHVIAGKRRVLAARKKGQKTIPAMVFESNVPESTIDIYLVSENMARSDNPAYEVEAINKLMASHNWSAKTAAEKLGVSYAKVLQRMKLLKLTPELFKRIKEGSIRPSIAMKLASLPSAKQKEFHKMEKITMIDVGRVFKASKLEKLIADESLFVVPDELRPISQVREILSSLIARGEDNASLLMKALDLVDQYREVAA